MSLNCTRLFTLVFILAEVFKVLVLDDDAAVLTLLKKWLTALGCESFTTSSVEDAVKLINKNSFNLILVDKNLGNLDDGLRFVHTIKKIAEYSKHSKIVLMSAEPVSSEEGFMFLEKPFDFEVLKSLILG